MVAVQLTGNVANDDLDEYINISNKEKNIGICQRSVTLHILDSPVISHLFNQCSKCWTSRTPGALLFGGLYDVGKTVK